MSTNKELESLFILKNLLEKYIYELVFDDFFLEDKLRLVTTEKPVL